MNGKILAMISSKSKFVLKLSKERVDELVSTGKGERFDPGHGKVMKEWFVARRKRPVCFQLPTSWREPRRPSTFCYLFG